MSTEKLSLMTFSMAKDLVRKTMTIEDTLQMAAGAGIPCVDVMRVNGNKIPEYRAAMERTGVSVYCYIAVVSFFDKEERIVANLNKEFEVAASLDAKLFMIIPFYAVVDEWKARKQGREQIRQCMARGFRIAVENGKRFGLQVCFETTPQDVLCLSGTEDCKWMLDQVPGLGLVFDTANMLPHGDDPFESYKALKEYMVHVHLKDVALEEYRFSLFPKEHTQDGKIMRATAFGEGVIPVRELYDQMCNDGYDGRFAIEYIHPAGNPMTLTENSEHLQHYVDALKT